MSTDIRLKVCGLTTEADARAAHAAGADYLGFVFYPPSPRNISPAQFARMRPQLPPRKFVAVCVAPSADDLARLAGLEFDYFQIHFKAHEPPPHLAGWSGAVGRSRLWLAPKLAPPQEIKPEWLSLAATFLLDAFHPEKFGGTGQFGDWEYFRCQQSAHPAHEWILSGGLNPGNIVAAVTTTGAKFVDVNSGVESSPGRKDPAKLQSLAAALGRLKK